MDLPIAVSFRRKKKPRVLPVAAEIVKQSLKNCYFRERSQGTQKSEKQECLAFS
jgi:hypothetical protein